MKKTLSKLAAGVGVLTLAVSLTACGGAKLTTDEATCKEFRTQGEKIAGGSIDNLASDDIGSDKLRELYAKMDEIGKKSEAPVGKAFVTLAGAAPTMIEVREKLKANPSDADAMKKMNEALTPEVQAASTTMTETCDPFWK